MNLRIYLTISLFVCIGCSEKGMAQPLGPFDTLAWVPSTPLKNQQSSGTCWSFATTSFLETEALRLGKAPVTLSPIFYVPSAYLGKAERFIQTQGKTYFASGDLTFSVLNTYDSLGAVPESVYNGIIAGDWQHDHVEMDNLLAEMVSSIGTSGYGRIKPNSWRMAIQGVLTAYLGQVPDTFRYQGTLYTPKSFAAQHIGIDPSAYVEITSYTQCPFYGACVLDIPANWGGQSYLNLPIADFEAVLNHALDQGYSLAWDGDVSELGFNFNTGKLSLLTTSNRKQISQTQRQKAFDKGKTQDEHNMHIIGKVRDQNGHIWYAMKNSEGLNDMGGYVYMDRPSLLLKTISLLVHKDGIPAEIRGKTYLAHE